MPLGPPPPPTQKGLATVSVLHTPDAVFHCCTCQPGDAEPRTCQPCGKLRGSPWLLASAWHSTVREATIRSELFLFLPSNLKIKVEMYFKDETYEVFCLHEMSVKSFKFYSD